MARNQEHGYAPAGLQPRAHWFLRSVAAGIIGYVVIAMLAFHGAGREFAAAAVGCGVLAGVVVAVVRWARRGGLGGLLELLAGGLALSSLVDLGRRTLR
jgi:hypothetical protein